MNLKRVISTSAKLLPGAFALLSFYSLTKQISQVNKNIVIISQNQLAIAGAETKYQIFEDDIT